jgi:hypothetical protein
VPRRLLSAPAIVAAALALASAAGAATDSFDGVPFSPFTIAPGNLACVGWSDDVAGPTRLCDPINVLFPGRTLAGAVARLHAAGWRDADGGAQWLYFAAGALLPVQAQLEVPDGPDPTQRYHLRLWQAAPGLVVGNVHHEHGSPHAIDMAWDGAQAFLARTVCGARCGEAFLPTQASMEGASGLWRGWPNDAVATVVPSPRARPHAPASRRG